MKSGWGRRCFSCNSSHNVLPIRCSFSSARNLQKFDQGGHLRILPLIFVAHAAVLHAKKWRTRLRWLLEFSSKRQKKRDASLRLPPPLSTPLPPPTHLPRRCLWGRSLREKQVIITEHSETNHWSRKWLINIKIPSSDAPRDWDLHSSAQLNNNQVGRGCARYMFTKKKGKKKNDCPYLHDDDILDSHFLPHGPQLSWKVFWFIFYFFQKYIKIRAKSSFS